MHKHVPHMTCCCNSACDFPESSSSANPIHGWQRPMVWIELGVLLTRDYWLFPITLLWRHSDDGYLCISYGLNWGPFSQDKVSESTVKSRSKRCCGLLIPITASVSKRVRKFYPTSLLGRLHSPHPPCFVRVNARIRENLGAGLFCNSVLCIVLFSFCPFPGDHVSMTYILLCGFVCYCLCTLTSQARPPSVLCELTLYSGC